MLLFFSYLGRQYLWMTRSAELPKCYEIPVQAETLQVKVVSRWLVKHCSSQTKSTNKKVLLRERKRHTARRVASTPYIVLTGYPPGRVSPHPDLARGGVPYLVTPPGRVPPLAGPGRVPPPAFWVMLQSIMGYGYPPCGQTDRHVSKHYLSRRTTYAGGIEYKITYDKIITARSVFIFLHFHFNCGLSIFSLVQFLGASKPNLNWTQNQYEWFFYCF